MVSIYRATGYLRSSAYHNWPMQTPRYEGPRTWEEFTVSAEDGKAALERAVAAGELLNIPADLHPERRVVKYLGTGRAVSRLMLARATGSPEVVPLQVPNAGAVANFPPDVRVEVPAVVLKSMVIPMAVGEVPEWLGGTTRLLALQRKLHAEYLISGSKDSLVQALLTLPTVAPINVLMEYADVVHSLRR
jgi:alpha-galactosidase/6-phospho-beta-glucosidase family protein